MGAEKIMGEQSVLNEHIISRKDIKNSIKAIFLWRLTHYLDVLENVLKKVNNGWLPNGA